MPPKNPDPGEFNVGPSMSDRDRALHADFVNLEGYSRAVISEFNVDTEEARLLSIHPTAALVESDDPTAIRMRGDMLANLGIPRDKAKRPEELGWKEYKKQTTRISVLEREDQPTPVHAKIMYFDDGKVTVELLGKNKARQELRTLTYTPTEEEIDKNLATAFRMSAADIRALTINNEGLTLAIKREYLGYFQEIRGMKALPEIDEKQLGKLRRKVLRYSRPGKGYDELFEEASIMYKDFLLVSMGGNKHLDAESKKDIIAQERANRLSDLDDRLEARKTVKNVGKLALAGLAVGVSAVTGRFIGLGIEVFSHDSFDRTAGAVVGGAVAAAISIKQSIEYQKKLARIPRLKNLETPTSIVKQLEQERAKAAEYKQMIKEL